MEYKENEPQLPTNFTFTFSNFVTTHPRSAGHCHKFIISGYQFLAADYGDQEGILRNQQLYGVGVNVLFRS